MEIESLAKKRKRIYDEKDDAWKEKAMDRVFSQETQEVADLESWR